MLCSGGCALDLCLVLILCYVFVLGFCALIIKEVVFLTPLNIGYVSHPVESITVSVSCLVQLRIFLGRVVVPYTRGLVSVECVNPLIVWYFSINFDHA